MKNQVKIIKWMLLIFGVVYPVLQTPQHTVAMGSVSGVCDPNIFVHLSQKVVPSVVNISSVTRVKGFSAQGMPEDFFRKFFFGERLQPDAEDWNDSERFGPNSRSQKNRPLQKLPQSIALGTGFIIDAAGLILTNNHVVANADEIKINFTESLDEASSIAEVVGRDPELDVALIKVKTNRTMVPMILGDSEALQVGEYVAAIGNPFGQGHSVTHGIISAKGRLAPHLALGQYLQTDAPINPGNSGGPLVNLKGEVIGINNAIDQRAQGIGFAIPIHLVKKILPQLRTKGTVARGYIGVLVAPLTAEIASQLKGSQKLKGCVVSHVYLGEPADQIGIQPYDIITSFHGQPITSSHDLMMAVTAVPVGTAVPIQIMRNGVLKTLSISVIQRRSRDSLAQKMIRKKPSLGQAESAAFQMGMTLENVSFPLLRDFGFTGNLKAGVFVVDIESGGAADQSGLVRGDLILEVDRKPIHHLNTFYSLVKEKKTYLLRIKRISSFQGQEVFQLITLDLNGIKK